MKKIALFVCLLCLFVSCNNNDHSIEKYNAQHDSTIPAPTIAQKPAVNEDSLDLEHVISKFGDSNYLRAKDRQNVSSIASEADDFYAAQQIIFSVPKDSLKNKVAQAKKVLTNIQKKDFPWLRKNYVSVSHDRLWEENVDVNGFGDRNEYIEFTGGAFADHAVIKASQEALNDMLVKLRFKQVDYKWYSGADDYTTYHLNSKTDTDF